MRSDAVCADAGGSESIFVKVSLIYDAGLAEFGTKHHAIAMHTSGHATWDVLAKVIKAVNPWEAILPIHTENAKGFWNWIYWTS